ncbi:MAG: metal-dependent phosphohydrolase, partial [Acidimicrobiales bacterium]
MTAVDEVLELYDRWGGARYDEDVAQLDHALQTAALAASAGATDAVVAAALLHDAGHLLALRGDPVGPHERTGPAFLAALF